MKPWGSQAAVLHFLPPNLPAGQRRWLAGGPGGGKERPWWPHGWGELCGTEAGPTPAAATQRLGDARDYRWWRVWSSSWCKLLSGEGWLGGVVMLSLPLPHGLHGFFRRKRRRMAYTTTRRVIYNPGTPSWKG